ncbi:hypothetical protein RE6C_05078 [Rhodopirellula europaea 6C]|uniref:Uncharacterized protein n=1 Tax=Rhodopirellula europaea 6C TaxID=1263867 RepID=M2ABP0_9BACT|nr:hypothetical protein RE6C_05078 [Rhodopirellula europaea 6C]
MYSNREWDEKIETIQGGKDVVSDDDPPTPDGNGRTCQALLAYGVLPMTVSLQRGLFCLEPANPP